MKNISNIRLSHMRNDEHFQFMAEFIRLITKAGVATLKVGLLFDTFKVLYEREDEALKKIIKSEFTEKIHDADGERDIIYKKLVKLSTSFVYHHDMDVVDSAKRLKIVFSTYGNIIRKPLNEKTSAIYNILQELEGKYAADITAVGTGAWVAELKILNTEFGNLVQERFDEAAMRTDIVLKHARLEVDCLYRKIITRIGSYIDIEGYEQYEEFVKTINTIITKYAATLASRTGKHKNTKYEEHEDVGEIEDV